MENVVGDCGVCGTALSVGANHAYTACKHLFCISCLLKWHKHSAKATCPLCRRPLYDETEHDADADADADGMQFNQIVEEMDFNLDEEIMHDHMMEVINFNVRNHYRNDPAQRYTGTIHLRIIPKEHYESIDIGIANSHACYILELIDTARAFRYRFGRIETIDTDHRFPNLKWYAFRERIDRIDEERAQIVTEWANEIQHIAIDNVKVMRHYSPEIQYNL